MPYYLMLMHASLDLLSTGTSTTPFSWSTLHCAVRYGTLQRLGHSSGFFEPLQPSPFVNLLRLLSSPLLLSSTSSLHFTDLKTQNPKLEMYLKTSQATVPARI